MSRFAAPAMAVGETLAVTLTQLDGEEAWNWQDDSDTNGIVRTNDSLQYEAEVTVTGGAATNTLVTFTIP